VGPEVLEVTSAPVKQSAVMMEGHVVQCTHEQLKQQRNDGAPSHQWEGKQKADPEEDKEDGMGF
jgi:hypothetical protein